MPRGTRTVKVEPSAGRLSTATVPPCSVRELGDQRQADAGPLEGPRPRPVDPVEPLEEVRQLVLGDAGPGVGDLQDRGAVLLGAAGP